jgi:hypothetical protein
MKKIYILLLLVYGFSNAQNTGNYTITIGDETFNYTMGEEFGYDVKKKGPLKLRITQNELLHYNDGIVSFDHTISFPVTKTELEVGITQILTMSPTGIGAIIQEYDGLNPELMIDLMLNELTKESIDYGYKNEITTIEFTLPDGKIMKGKKSILTYQGATDEWIVVAYGAKDQGVLVAAMNVDSNGLNKGATFVEDFFKSLKINF